MLGAQERFAAALVAPPDLLTKLALDPPASRQAVDASMEPWQASLVAAELYEALIGHRALHLGPNDVAGATR